MQHETSNVMPSALGTRFSVPQNISLVLYDTTGAGSSQAIFPENNAAASAKTLNIIIRFNSRINSIYRKKLGQAVLRKSGGRKKNCARKMLLGKSGAVKEIVNSAVIRASAHATLGMVVNQPVHWFEPLGRSPVAYYALATNQLTHTLPQFF